MKPNQAISQLSYQVGGLTSYMLGFLYIDLRPLPDTYDIPTDEPWSNSLKHNCLFGICPIMYHVSYMIDCLYIYIWHITAPVERFLAG